MDEGVQNLITSCY